MSRRRGFTLAEVLITLGVIGVVAAMTLPMLIQNYQKTVLKSQFKKVYAEFFNAIKLTQSKMEAPVYCFYWDKRPYGYNAVCIEHNEYGSCTKYETPDGDKLPSDYNGLYSNCRSFYDELFGKSLKIAKYCPNNALSNGCITEDYRGIDKVKTEIDDSVQYDPNSAFSDSIIKQKAESWILVDGTVILKYNGSNSSTPIFTIDINGHKKPNKWGYDLFSFQFKGTPNDGITKLNPVNYYYEKGGFTTAQMLFESHR